MKNCLFLRRATRTTWFHSGLWMQTNGLNRFCHWTCHQWLPCFFLQQGKLVRTALLKCMYAFFFYLNVKLVKSKLGKIPWALRCYKLEGGWLRCMVVAIQLGGTPNVPALPFEGPWEASSMIISTSASVWQWTKAMPELYMTPLRIFRIEGFNCQNTKS